MKMNSPASELEILFNEYLGDKKLLCSEPLDTPLTELPLDSLDQVELFMLIEKKWNILLTSEDIINIKCLRDCIPFIEQHLNL